MTARSALIWFVPWMLVACSGASAHEPPVETPQEEASVWRVWRPCGCAEGCVRVSPADAIEGAEVTVHESWVREGARPVEEGVQLRVESAEGTSGEPVLVATHLAGLCGYLCQTELAGPVAPNACASGQLAMPSSALAM